MPLKLASEHLFSSAFALGPKPGTSAVTAAIVRVFAMVLDFMIVSFAFIKLPGFFVVQCPEMPADLRVFLGDPWCRWRSSVGYPGSFPFNKRKVREAAVKCPKAGAKIFQIVLKGSYEQRNQKHLYEFGPYRLDPGRKLLLRNGDLVALTSKALEILLVLVERSEHVVTKDELMKEVWPNTFVEEANLTQHISMVRKALGETPQDHRYILTFPGQGYRFAGGVRIV